MKFHSIKPTILLISLIILVFTNGIQTANAQKTKSLTLNEILVKLTFTSRTTTDSNGALARYFKGYIPSLEKDLSENKNCHQK